MKPAYKELIETNKVLKNRLKEFEENNRLLLKYLPLLENLSHGPNNNRFNESIFSLHYNTYVSRRFIKFIDQKQFEFIEDKTGLNKNRDLIRHFDIEGNTDNNQIANPNQSIQCLNKENSNQQEFNFYNDFADNEDFGKSLQKLQELNATKDKLFSIIAHDLKSPFNNILGFAELLLVNHRHFDGNKREKFLSHIFQSASQVYSLLENLLEWSRSQTGQLEIKPSLIRLNELVKDVLFLFDHIALRKNISITTKLPDNISVFADENMLRTILRNLVSNAIKFSNQKGKIIVQAIIKGKVVEISISDNGIGMTGEEIANIFHFNKNYTTPGTGHEIGTGLGLMICQEFVAKNGGIIWVESKPDKGSKFKFTLPKAC